MAARPAATGWGDPISFQAYQHLAMVCRTIATTSGAWAGSGAPIWPSFVNRYAVLLPPLLLAAGIGEVSRAGIILNRTWVWASRPRLSSRHAAGLRTGHRFRPAELLQILWDLRSKLSSGAIPTGDKVMYNGVRDVEARHETLCQLQLHTAGHHVQPLCEKLSVDQSPTWQHNLVRSAVSSAWRSEWRSKRLLCWSQGKHTLARSVV